MFFKAKRGGKSMWWLLVILVACAQVPQMQETIYSFEPYEPPKMQPRQNETKQVPMVKNETPVVKSVTLNTTVEPAIQAPIPVELPAEEIIEDLTIAQQHKMISVLEEDTKKSACYELTWSGFENESQQLPLAVDKQLRFEYLGARLFKGWILNRLLVQKEQVAAETVELLWDDGAITCIDNANFSTDWDKIHRRFGWTH